MMKLYFFISLFMSSIAIAQNDTIYLEQIEITDNKQSYNLFFKKIHLQKLKYDKKQASFNIKINEKEYQGELYLKNLKIDSITFSVNNEMIKKISEQILKVAYTSWYLIYQKKIKDFTCQQIDDYSWKFMNFKSNKKLKIEEFDNLEMKVHLSENGKLSQNTLSFLPKEGKKYKMDVSFSNLNDELEIKTIKGIFIDEKIVFDINF